MENVISRWLKNTHNSLFDNLNNYHEKIKFTIETNLQIFLDTRLLLENDIIKSYRKANKFPVHWKSQIPETYIVHGESAQIFIMRKTKLEINFQVLDTQLDLLMV